MSSRVIGGAGGLPGGAGAQVTSVEHGGKGGSARRGGSSTWGCQSCGPGWSSAQLSRPVHGLIPRPQVNRDPATVADLDVVLLGPTSERNASGRRAGGRQLARRGVVPRLPLGQRGGGYSATTGWNEADIEDMSIFDMDSMATGLVSRAAPPAAWSMSA